jgi:hypothetical protein
MQMHKLDGKTNYLFVGLDVSCNVPNEPPDDAEDDGHNDGCG